MRSPLIRGHGNFGSIDADPPAAMRYTECRLEVGFFHLNYFHTLSTQYDLLKNPGVGGKLYVMDDAPVHLLSEINKNYKIIGHFYWCLLVTGLLFNDTKCISNPYIMK